MKSLIDYILDIFKIQKELDLQNAEILVNQEYANCLMELNQTEN